jgi:membrane protease YdiL (CAAX protease family)
MEIQIPYPPKRDPLQFIFFNDRGLRPGWRLAIFIVIVFALTIILSIPLSLLRRPGHGLEPSSLILEKLFELTAVLVASWAMSHIEQRNMGEYGLPVQNAGIFSRFVRGYIFWGFLPLTLLLLLLRALHTFYFGNVALHGIQVFSWAGIWGLLFILVGLHEEYLLRGYALYTLSEGIGFWPAAVVLASVFATLHTFNKGEARVGIIMTALFALFASVTLRYTGNLWMAAGLHAGWDWGQSYFYGTPNSGLVLPGHLLNPHTQGPAWLTGGSVGPEGSVLTLVLLAVMSILFVLLYRRRRRPALLVTRGKPYR